MKIQQRIRGVAALLLLAFAVQADAADPLDGEVRQFFEKFVQVQNAHDTKALDPLLADSPQFLWITRGMTIWGREAAMQRFAKLHEGSWKLEPEMGAFRVVPMGEGVAQIHVPVVFTTGAPGEPAQTTRMFLNQVLVKSGGGWRVMSIFPVPAPAR